MLKLTQSCADPIRFRAPTSDVADSELFQANFQVCQFAPLFAKMELSRPFVAGLVVGAAVTAVVLSQRKQNARHTPSAVLRDSALENVFAPIKRQYSVTTADLNNIVDNMISEMKKGQCFPHIEKT